MKTILTSAAAILAVTGTAYAASHSMAGVTAADQSVANGVVSADSIEAPENGWLVVHRTDAEMAPGPVVGHAPLRAGMNEDVAAILTEEVASGDMLMLMVHSEAGGMETGVFEYTLGAEEDGPIRMDGELVMTVITAE